MSVDGVWEITIQTPMGTQVSTVELVTDGGTLSGTQSGNGDSGPIYDASVDGDTAKWTVDISKPMSLKVKFTATVEGDRISGKASAGLLGSVPFSGERR